MRLLVSLLLAIWPWPVLAGLTQAQLAAVGVAIPPAARLDPGLPLRDEQGRGIALGELAGQRPIVLLLADYTCNTLCGAAASMLAGVLEETGLEAGRDYHPVVMGLDPKDGPEQAADAKARELASFPDVDKAFRFVTADPATVETVTGALGYRFAYDVERDQFAHPAVVYVLAADGRVTRVLAGLTLVSRDVRLAIVEAGEGRVGSLADRVRLMCYGYDAARGVYTPSIMVALQVLSVATLLGLGALLLSQRGRI